ncbi:MAG: malonyl-ACP O-methyltransferase BioC [Bacillota bacterium]|nr:malonyl-ACP O-methyltransferase BioC [Bacillota bacterium]
MIDKQQVKIHFSKNASSYDYYAKVQKLMAHTLIDFILKEGKIVSSPKSILEIGCGTGYLTNLLTELFPNSHITAVDIAPGMISKMKSKLVSENIDFICGDIEEIKLDNTYDLIISNATFQWFNNTSATIKKLYSALNPKGILCFSTFGNHTFFELRQCFNMITTEMCINDTFQPSQHFYTLEDLYKLCTSASKLGLSQCKSSIYFKEILQPEHFNSCKDFFLSIKKVGANNSNKSKRCTSPLFIKKVMDYYDKTFKENNKVKATYHCIFVNMIK